MDWLPTSAVDAAGVAGALASRGVTLAAFGAAYLFVLVNVVVGACCYVLARMHLVVAPNRASKRYGLYAAAVLLSLILATILENELVPNRAAAFSYASLPHVALLLAIHWCIYERQEPWLVTLGLSAIVGAIPAAAAAAAVTTRIGPAHWLSLLVLCLLAGWLWRKSVSTKYAFTNAKSIYVSSKEDAEAPAAAPAVRLGLDQWVALVAASLALATVNAMLRGDALPDVRAAAVLVQCVLILAATAAVSAVPAAAYWWAHRTWMPELGRFVWLVWLVIGFAASYGTYLKRVAPG